MQKTKLKIINTTINLFNQHGFANVSLPRIAKEMSISLGNLTYHFPKKDQLIMAIYDIILTDLKAITTVYQTPIAIGIENLLEFDGQFKAFYDFQQKYRFFYLDLLELERAYPVLEAQHQAHIQNKIEELHQYFLFNIQTGDMLNKPEAYSFLAQQVWMTVVFWPMQSAVRGVENSKAKMVETGWFLLSPYLTEKGKATLENEITTLKEQEINQ